MILIIGLYRWDLGDLWLYQRGLLEVLVINPSYLSKVVRISCQVLLMLAVVVVKLNGILLSLAISHDRDRRIVISILVGLLNRHLMLDTRVCHPIANFVLSRRIPLPRGNKALVRKGGNSLKYGGQIQFEPKLMLDLRNRNLGLLILQLKPSQDQLL